MPAEIRSHRPAGPLRVLYAWVVALENGEEGVVRRDTPFGTQPLIADSLDTAELLRPFADEAVRDMPAVKSAAKCFAPPGSEQFIGLLRLAKFVRVDE